MAGLKSLNTPTLFRLRIGGFSVPSAEQECRIALACAGVVDTVRTAMTRRIVNGGATSIQDRQTAPPPNSAGKQLPNHDIWSDNGVALLGETPCGLPNSS